MPTKPSTPHMRPIENLKMYLERKELRRNAGLIGGKIYLNGKYYTLEDFERYYAEIPLTYAGIQLDGTQIES